MSDSFSRRGFLAGSAVAATGAALVACSSSESDSAEGSAAENSAIGESTVPFDGDHQAGIDTPGQAVANVIGFKLKDGVKRDDFRRFMVAWTDDARRLTQGVKPLGSLEPEMVTTPSNLTITVGYGPKIFDVIGQELPEFMKPIPKFERDKLDPAWGQADVVLQLCCNDPLTLSHATRHMIRSSPTYVTTQWMQRGFAKGAGTKPPQSPTARNLFGQIDGTVNPHTPEEFDEQVWIDDGPEWAKGSTVMVVRRIRMNLDTWELLDRTSRENAMGRRLSDGAPLTGGTEFDSVDLAAVDELGLPIVDKNSHIARAKAPVGHGEQKLLRRPFSYELPPDHLDDGQLSNSGLIFICFQKDPHKQFVPIQKRLDEKDLLNTWITHIGSGSYWVPPGTSDEADYWGSALLG